MFTKVRADLVPRLARESYAEARSAFAAQDGDTARAKFQRTIDIIDHLPEAERASLADLRLLAAGFLDLATARPAPPPPAPAPELPPAPAPAPEYVGPVVITEQLPAWVPPDGSARWTEFNGLLRVEIDEAGNVTAVHVVESSHPAYDAALVRAAKEWTYQPATRAGRAVASEKSIKIRLVPR